MQKRDAYKECSASAQLSSLATGMCVRGLNNSKITDRHTWSVGFAQTCSVCSPRDSGWLTNGVAAEAAAAKDCHAAEYGSHVGDNAELGALSWHCTDCAAHERELSGACTPDEGRAESSLRGVVSQLWWQNASDMVLAGVIWCWLE